jgi:heterodisulfide reductase subunit A-like polyferredoxin
LALSVGIGTYLYERREQKKIEQEENRLVVAAGCATMEEARSVSDKLEKEGVKAMIVERESPIYIKGSDSAFQVQVCYKDLKRAEKLLKG